MSYEPEKNKAYLNERYAEQRAMFIALLGGKCAVCGVKENLQIDHIYWQNKGFDVGQLWGKKSLPKVLEELDKCQLLCEDHHKLKTKQDQAEMSYYKPINHGKMYAWMKLKCLCEVCTEARHTWHDQRNAKRRAGPARGPYQSRK